MKKTAYILLSALLCAALLLGGCGGGNQPPVTEPPATEPTGESVSVTAADPVAQPIEAEHAPTVQTALSDYALTVQPMDHARETEPTFDGLGLFSPQNYDTDTVRLNVALRQAQGGETVFDIFVRCAFPAAYLQEGNPVTGTLRARYGEKWLFSLHGAIEEDEDYYIYNAAENALIPLAASGSALFFGSRILLHAAAYSEEALTPANLYDWNGSPVTSYPEVLDLCVSGDTLYLLRYADPAALYAVSVAALADPTGDLAAEKLCEFGPYYGMFYNGDSLVVQPLAGGAPVTCPLADAAATVEALKADAAVSESEIAETCGDFTVLLPAWWEGRYLCEKGDAGMAFRYKTAPDDGDGVFLFFIGVSQAPEDFDAPGFGSVGPSYEVCALEKGGETQYLLVEEPEEYSGINDSFYDEYMDMLAFLSCIETRVRGENGWQARPFDYAGAVGVYAGTDAFGCTYKLTLENWERNVLSGRLWFGDTNGAWYAKDSARVRMFGSVGCLTWENCVDYETEEWEFGSGTFTLENGGALLTLNGPGDGWTRTDGAVALQRVYVPASPDRTYISGSVHEENGLLRVALPDCWKGLYECRKDGDEIAFMHKPTGDGAPGLLFGLEFVDPAAEDQALGTPVYRYTENGKERTVIVYYPVDVQPTLTYAEQYSALAEGIADVLAALRPAKDGARLERFSLGFMGDRYTGEDAEGNTLVFTLGFNDKYSAACELICEDGSGERLYRLEGQIYLTEDGGLKADLCDSFTNPYAAIITAAIRLSGREMRLAVDTEGAEDARLESGEYTFTAS